jgi:uncharacterized protein (DUF736 family)
LTGADYDRQTPRERTFGRFFPLDAARPFIAKQKTARPSCFTVLRPWFLIGFAGFMEALCAGVRAAFACHLLSAVKAAKMVFTARRIKEEALMGAIGQVTKQIDGSYKGNLRTISIKAGIEIVPNAGKDLAEGKEDLPDYRVFTDDKVEIGAGWHRIGKNSGKRYVSLSLAAPEFGPRKLYCNLGQAAGKDDDTLFALIWNPAD